MIAAEFTHELGGSLIEGRPGRSPFAMTGAIGMIEGSAVCFAGLADPREASRCDHRLVDTLAIAVCAVIACGESWEDIELHGRSERA